MQSKHERTKGNIETTLYQAIAKLATERVRQIAPDLANEAGQIAMTILAGMLSGMEKEFIGDKLTQKIINEVAKRRQQGTNHYLGQPSRTENGATTDY